MKRNLVTLFLVVLCIAVSGCSRPDDTPPDQAYGHLDPKNPVTVSLWHYYVGENQQALNEAVATFNQTLGIEQGVIVEANPIGSIAELETAVTDSAKGVIGAAPMPQLFSSYPDKAMEIDALGMVAELNGYFSEEEMAAYVSDFLSDGMFDGDRLLVLPIVKSTELMYVNRTSWDAFASAEGLDEAALSTWEGLAQTAAAYMRYTDGATPETTGDGKALMGFDSVANFIIVANEQLGVDVISAKAGAAILDHSALRRIFDIYCPAYSLGHFDSAGKFRSDDIKAGNMIAYVGSSSSAAYFPTWIEADNVQSPIDFMPLPYPTFEGTASIAIQQGAGMCIAKSTPAQQEGAALFLKWFTAPEQNIDFAMTTGYLPVQTAAYSSDAFQAALDTLRSGEKTQQNVAGVYDIALYQITESSTYAARPFPGSYDIRSTLQATLIQAGLDGRAAVQAMDTDGLSDDQVLSALDVDARFDAWLAAIRDALDSLEIPYQEQTPSA